MADAAMAEASTAKASLQRIENQIARVETERTKAAEMLSTSQAKVANSGSARSSPALRLTHL